MKRLLIPIVICSLLIGCGKPTTEAAKDEHGPSESGHVEGEAAHEEGKEGKEGHVEGQVKLSPDGLKLAGVETFTAQTREIQDSLRIPGTVMSTTKGRAVVTPPIAGRVV